MQGIVKAWVGSRGDVVPLWSVQTLVQRACQCVRAVLQHAPRRAQSPAWCSAWSVQILVQRACSERAIPGAMCTSGSAIPGAEYTWEFLVQLHAAGCALPGAVSMQLLRQRLSVRAQSLVQRAPWHTHFFVHCTPRSVQGPGTCARQRAAPGAAGSWVHGSVLCPVLCARSCRSRRARPCAAQCASQHCHPAARPGSAAARVGVAASASPG